MDTGKYYECVFCKRGFTTAQALGGHMNIHKKDRLSKKGSLPRPPSTSIKVGDKYLNLKPYVYSSIHNHRFHPYFYSAAPKIIPAHRQHHYLAAGPSRISNYLPEKLTYHNAHCYKGTDQRGCNLNLLAGDCRPGSSLLLSEPSPSHICASKRKMEVIISTEENGLDLELRLGRHP